jgi:hypothetical protein
MIEATGEIHEVIESGLAAETCELLPVSFKTLNS